MTRLDVVKIDTEGAEVSSLAGAQNVIAEFRPKIVIEYNREALRRAGTSIEELDCLLDRYGYDRYPYWGQLKMLDLSGYVGRRGNEVVFNVICLPRH